MGASCCSDRPKPRGDLPIRGQSHVFRIMADSFSSWNFTAYDGTDGKEGAPWLRLVHSNNIDDHKGEIVVERCMKMPGESALLMLQVSGVQFKEVDAKHNSELHAFFSGDKKTKMAWEILRSLKILEPKGNSLPAAPAAAKAKAKGKAKAKAKAEAKEEAKAEAKVEAKAEAEEEGAAEETDTEVRPTGAAQGLVGGGGGGGGGDEATAAEGDVAQPEAKAKAKAKAKGKGKAKAKAKAQAAADAAAETKEDGEDADDEEAAEEAKVEDDQPEPKAKAKAKGKGKAKAKAKAQAKEEEEEEQDDGEDAGSAQEELPVGLSRGSEVSGDLKVSYFGVAWAHKHEKKAIESKAVTQKVVMDLTYRGLELKVKHNLNRQGRWDRGSASYGQTYTVPGMFQVTYETYIGRDVMEVRVEPTADPLVAVALGFVIAYWMHPSRVEDNAARKAKHVLKQRCQWLF